MKKFASIAAVVAILLASALYYGSLQRDQNTDQPDPIPDQLVKEPVDNTGDPTTKAQSQGTLTLAGAISHGYVNRADASSIYASLDVSAVTFDGGERPPLNVAVVIDRSGSMSGGKIDDAKRAAQRLVGMLSDKDRVSIVSYASDVTVDYPSRLVMGHNREMMMSAIGRIQIGGGTNLSGGYEQGLSQVNQWNDGKGAINRVLLMSDGNANIGTTYLPDLQRMARGALSSGVSLTTIGVGLDYNEDLMTAMANEGAGNYYFVDSAAKISEAFNNEVQALAKSVARDTGLVIKLEPGVEVEQVFGFPFSQRGDTLTISMGEFSSEQRKNVLMKLRATASAQIVDQFPIMQADLSYTDLLADSEAAHQSVALSSVVTTDASKVEGGIDSDVIARVQQIEIAESMKQAMDMYGDGRGDEAVQMLERRRRSVRQARKKYHITKGADDFERVDREIGSMNDTIKAAPASSDSGKRMIKAKKARSNDIHLYSNF